MDVESDPFLIEETTIRRLDLGLFKGDNECTNCETIKPCIRVCKRCKAYICGTCFVRYIIEEISFKSLCRNRHATSISTVILNTDDESNSSTLANY